MGEAIKLAGLWAEFGLQGLVIFSLFSLVIFLIVESRRSRTEFMGALREITKILDQRQKETNEAISALAIIIERNIGGCKR